MNIYLYGDNFISRRALSKLTEYGLNVISIIDRKYSLPAFDGEVFTCGLDNIYQSENISTSLAIICLSDATKHLTVVNTLQAMGFSKILYIPMHFNRAIYEQSQLRNIYTEFFNGTYANIDKTPSTLKKLSNENTCWIIKEEGNQVIFLCKPELLYTATPELITSNILPNRESQTEKLLNISNTRIDNLVSYIDLFNYLNGSTPKPPEEYLCMQRNSEKEMQDLLENRRQLFNIYEDNYEYNFSFFYETPAKVIWNHSGYFNIEDGLHRSIYLLSKKKKRIPVSASKQDYNFYIASNTEENI